MSSKHLRMRIRAFFAFRALAIGILLGPAVALAEPGPESIAVNVDQAKLVKLPTRVSTIVVGNPLIADVTLQPGGLIVVTGKGYGATNFIAMDRAGEVWSTASSRSKARPTSSSRSIVASSVSRIAACRSASGG